MELEKLEVGDVFFGAVPRYSRLSMSKEIISGWRVVGCIVTKVNHKTIHLAWNKYTHKYPDVHKRSGEADLYCKSKREVLEKIIIKTEERIANEEYLYIHRPMLKNLKRQLLKLNRKEKELIL